MTGRGWLVAAVLTAAGSAGGVVVYGLLGEVVGERGLVDLELVRIAIVVGMVNGALALPVSRPLQWALRRSGPAPIAARIR